MVRRQVPRLAGEHLVTLRAIDTGALPQRKEHALLLHGGDGGASWEADPLWRAAAGLVGEDARLARRQVCTPASL